MTLYIKSPKFVGYCKNLVLFTSELEHFVINYREDCELTQELIKFCADAELPTPIFETEVQDANFELILKSDGIVLYNENGKLIAGQDFEAKVLRTVSFFYKDKKGKTGRRIVDVLEEDDTYLKGIDLDKGEYRQFLQNRISRLVMVNK